MMTLPFFYDNDTAYAFPPPQQRWLQEEETMSSFAPSLAPSMAPTSEDERTPSDGKVLRDTFTVYGSVLVVVWVFFCYVRLKYPRPFTVRQWTTNPDLFTSLAADQYGFWSWMWELNNNITEDELLDQTGLDALCFLRLLRMGYKLCLIGVVNSIWLMPVYATAESSSDTDHIDDPIVKLTVSHVPAESQRFLATVFAAYILFGGTMYLILQEFTWFIEMRHKFLKKRVPRNYTLYCRNVPMEYRTNNGLERFFRECFDHSAVVQANLKLTTPTLTKTVQQREKAIFNLEHSMALEDITGVPPQHVQKTSLAGSLIPGGGQKVNSIDHYAQEVKELNKQVTDQINAIHHKMVVASSRRHAGGSVSVAEYSNSTVDVHPLQQQFDPLLGSTDIAAAALPTTLEEQEQDVQDRDAEAADQQKDGDAAAASTTATSTKKPMGESSHHSSSSKKSDGLLGNISSSAGRAVKGVTAVLGISEDGEYLSGGFVSFQTLSTTNAAKQMVHHQLPFTFEVSECPDPDDIFWNNVGREHVDLQLGNLFSRAATATLCIFWTIPMAAISSLSSVEGLKEFDFVADLLEDHPSLEPVVEQLAPLLIIIVNALLPYILEAFSMLEGPVSGSVVVASTFSKLAWFMIIQTFFVTAVSGGLMDEIKNIIDDPLSTIDLLATSLPGQSTFFMQLAFVGTVMFIVFENLRMIALATAWLRRYIGPNLTEKERQTTYFGIRPLADPLDFEHDSNTAQIVVLYFMIVLVYQTIAPLSSIIVGFCFLLLRPACLHQFIYIYPTKPDSGGVIWTSFIKIILVCLLIAELTIVGLLGLKKAAIATPLMFPLIIVTLLFNGYLRQEHFRVTEVLPSKECLKTDRKYAGESLDFVKDQYVQEEMREKEAFPEDMSEDRAIELGLVPTVLASLDNVLPGSDMENIAASTNQEQHDPLIQQADEPSREKQIPDTKSSDTQESFFQSMFSRYTSSPKRETADELSV